MNTNRLKQQIADVIFSEIQEKGKCVIRNFGVFELQHRKGRKRHNVATRKVEEQKPYMILTFKSSHSMRRRLNS